jgi:competence ComEA-like helix-hairpin-helix protein
MVAMDASQQHARATAERTLGFGLAICLCAAVATVLIWGVIGHDAQAPPLSPGERINPNEAGISSLVRLPGIGWSKAQAILTYREQRRAATPAFRGPNDLTRIRGIGPKTAEAISAWLDFNEPEVESGVSPSRPAD